MNAKAYELFEKIYGNFFRFNSENFFEWNLEILQTGNYLNSRNLDNRQEKLEFLLNIKNSNLRKKLKAAFKKTAKLAECYNYDYKFTKNEDFICDEMYFLAPIFNTIVKLNNKRKKIK